MLSRNSGFSLMELMVVVGIIAILSAIAIPSLSTMVPSFRLRSTARDMVSCYQEARLRAIKENTTVVVIADLPNDRLTAFVDNGPGAAAGNWALDASEKVVRQIDIPSQIDLYLSTIPFNTMGFNGRGLPATATGFGNLYIKTSGANYREISINATGSVRIRRSADGANWN